jgi:hypothetical protein
MSNKPVTTVAKPSASVATNSDYKKKIQVGLNQVLKNFSQGWSFISSSLWVLSSWTLLFLFPLSFALASSMSSNMAGNPYME